MKLNKIEKIVILVIVLGLILAGGFFMFVMPSIENIQKNQKTLDANKAELAALDERLARLDTIDADITEQRNEAIKLEGGFYPDLTTYEASELGIALMKSHNLDGHAIKISPASTYTISIDSYTPKEVTYDLRTFSKAASQAGEETEEVEGTFTDGGKNYSVRIDSILGGAIVDEEGQEVDPSRYTDKMKNYYLAALCSYITSNNLTQTVGISEIEYEVTGKAKDIRTFIDDLYNLDRATAIAEVTYTMTFTPQNEEDSSMVIVGENGSILSNSEAQKVEIVVEDDTELTISFKIKFLSVEPMQQLKSLDAGGTEIALDLKPTVY